MHFIILALSAITCGYLFISLIEFFFGLYSLKNLQHQVILPKETLPSVTIILSALNEEIDIERSLISMLEQQYPHLEVIALNDRSTDSTPNILDNLQRRFPQLVVKHINALPSGWFGKNHALAIGATLAKGDWLLFTDADVLMKPNTIAIALSYTLEKNLDHLTIHEHHLRKTFWLKIGLLGHYLVYCIFLKPWRVRFSWSTKSLGHGAFNLVKKTAYLNCGGHTAIALECLDDLKLGALIKHAGYKQDTVDGRDYIEREWYVSLGAMVEGWRKNSFSMYNYKIAPIFWASIFVLIFFVLPPFAAVFATGAIQRFNILSTILTLLIAIYMAKHFRLPKRYIVFYPLAIVILLYAIWNSVFATLKNKGVIWRGTLYPLTMLKDKQQQKPAKINIS